MVLVQRGASRRRAGVLVQRRLRPAFRRSARRTERRVRSRRVHGAAARSRLLRRPADVDGRPAPQNPHTLAVRWTGFSNFELAYEGKIILLDAYFDRGRDYPPLDLRGRRQEGRRHPIGHGHYDHMSDAASVGIRTGAPLVGAALTTGCAEVRAGAVIANQDRDRQGRRTAAFDGFTVQPILALHGQPDKHVTQVLEGAYNSLLPKPDAERRPRKRRSRRAAPSIPVSSPRAPSPI